MTALAALADLRVPDELSIASVAQQGYALFLGDDLERARNRDAMQDLLTQVRIEGSDNPVFSVREVTPFQLEITVVAQTEEVGTSKIHTPGGEVPLSDLVEIEDRSGDHSVEGILLARGPNIRRGVLIGEAHQVDIVPTVLYLLGFPVGQDMTGEILESVIDPDFLSRNPPRFIPSYDPLVPLEKLDESQGDRKELEERLRALGYLN